MQFGSMDKKRDDVTTQELQPHKSYIHVASHVMEYEKNPKTLYSSYKDFGGFKSSLVPQMKAYYLTS